LQKDIAVDSFVVSTHGLGIDNLLNFYRINNNEEEKQLVQSFVTQTQLNNNFAHPCISSASAALIKNFVDGFYQGITVTCPGFYGPQGRVLRLGLANPALIDNLTSFTFGQHRITNFEMETAGIYGLGSLLGHQCLSISAIVANRISKEFSKDGNATVENLIKKSLEIIAHNIA
jgi:uridine phosphorylase